MNYRGKTEWFVRSDALELKYTTKYATVHFCLDTLYRTVKIQPLPMKLQEPVCCYVWGDLQKTGPGFKVSFEIIPLYGSFYKMSSKTGNTFFYFLFSCSLQSKKSRVKKVWKSVYWALLMTVQQEGKKFSTRIGTLFDGHLVYWKVLMDILYINQFW